MNYKVTEIFYLIDEFCNEFDKIKKQYVLQDKTFKKTINLKCLTVK